jgi:hypothetical protein
MKSSRCLACVFTLVLGIRAVADEKTKPSQASYEIPYRLTNTQHVLIRAKINGKGPFNFILDTGAPTLFVATSVARQLGIEPDKAGWAILKEFEIEGGASIPGARARIETPFQLEGMNGLGLSGAQLHGIIGYTILARYRIEFDFTKDKLKWTRLDFNPPFPTGLRGQSGAAGGLDALGGVMKFMGALLGKKPEPELTMRGFLGIELADKGAGVDIKMVLPASPADKAGLKAGDHITHFDGKEVRSATEVQRLAKNLEPGKSARIRVARDGVKDEFQVTLTEGL